MAQAKLTRNQTRNLSATTNSNEGKMPIFCATNCATEASIMQPVAQLPSEKSRDFVYRETKLKLKYNQLLKREQTAEAWMDDPKRTDAEVEKWMPLFHEILAGLNSLINEIGLNNCTEAERLKGFDILPLLGKEVGLDGLPEEWQGGAN